MGRPGVQTYSGIVVVLFAKRGFVASQTIFNGGVINPTLVVIVFGLIEDTCLGSSAAPYVQGYSCAEKPLAFDGMLKPY